MPQWQDGGFEKPKFHPGEHLSMALEEFGPFRAFWCLPWEAFLQVLKRMFDMCNWKVAPQTVARHWATKSVMHYRDPKRGAWYTDEVVADADWAHEGEPLQTLIRGSELLRALLPSCPLQAARPISRVTRGPDDLKRGDWVVWRQPDSPARVGKVEQMMQCLRPGEAFSFVRMWCAQCKEIHEDEVNSIMWAVLGDSKQKALVSFEKVHIDVVVRSVCSSREEFI